MAIPDKAETASVTNRSVDDRSTGPWDNPALAKFREWEPLWVDQCLKMSDRPVDQRHTAAQRRRADQPCGECCLYELERRAEPAAIFAAHSKPARPAKRS